MGEQQDESTTVLPDIPSFCNYTVIDASCVSDVFGTHIENIGSRGGEHMRSYSYRVTHTHAVVVRNLRGNYIS